MKHSYLEVTYRKGRVLAAYYYLPRKSGDRVARSQPVAGGLLVDYTTDGLAIGIEITSPSRLVLADLNRVLQSLGHAPIGHDDLAPLTAA